MQGTMLDRQNVDIWKEMHGRTSRKGWGKTERYRGNKQTKKARQRRSLSSSATHHCGLSHWQQSLPPSQPSIMVMEAPSEHWFLGIVGKREGSSVLNGSARLVKARQVRFSAWITLTFLYVWLTRQSCIDGTAVHVLSTPMHWPRKERKIGGNVLFLGLAI